MTVQQALREQFYVLVVRTLQEASQILNTQKIAVLILDQAILRASSEDWLNKNKVIKIILTDSYAPNILEVFNRAENIFYVLRRPISARYLAEVAQCSIEHYRSPVLPRTEYSFDEAEDVIRLQTILASSRRLTMQRDLSSASRLVAEIIEEVIDANRGYCLIYNAATGELSSLGEGRRWIAILGLCSFAVRTRSAVQVDDVGEDSRYYKEFDDPEGRDDERFLAVPIFGRDETVLALLVALRDASRPCFSNEDRETLQKMAEQFALYFIQLNLQVEVHRALSRGASVVRERQLKIFREEALESLATGHRNYGDLLHTSPTWTKWFYWLLCLIFLVGVLYSFFGSINEYAVGSAIVRVEGRSNLTAISSGTVSSIEVYPGQAVVAGQLLVHFYNAQEAIHLDRINKELEFYLLESLRNPSNPAPQQSLTSLRAQKQIAEAQLEQRSVRASQAGIVSDIRTRPGQFVSTGETLLSLVNKDTNPSMTAIVPGHYRPLLKRGMSLRLELSGYQYAYQDLAIESIGEEIVGPIEIRRHLGQNVADTIAITGPVVIIYGRLPSHTFEADGRQYEYYDGLQGKVEIRIRSERILFHLIPALKSLLGRGDG